LNPATTYYFRVLSKDASAVVVTGLDYTFITAVAPVSVSLTPASVTLQSSGTQQFAATVTNSSNQTVTWSASAGTINASGWFTAPKVTADQTVTVKATSAAGPTKSATASVSVKAPPPVLSVNPTTLNFAAQQGGANPAASTVVVANSGGGTLSFTVTADVAWLSISPVSGYVPASLQVAPGIPGLVAGDLHGAYHRDWGGRGEFPSDHHGDSDGGRASRAAHGELVVECQHVARSR
jgi:hypothetical protein